VGQDGEHVKGQINKCLNLGSREFTMIYAGNILDQSRMISSLNHNAKEIASLKERIRMMTALYVCDPIILAAWLLVVSASLPELAVLAGVIVGVGSTEFDTMRLIFALP
jgi:hypothetical protein